MLLKTFSIILYCFLIAVHSSTAQNAKKIQLEVDGSIDYALNEGYSLLGFGSNVKLLIPVGKKNNALVTSLGFDRLYEELDYEAYSYTFFLSSIGYRKTIRSAFIEPKLGFGSDIESGYESFCGFGGLEVGIERGRFIFSTDYRFITLDGLVEGDYFHTFAIKIGYKIFGKN